MLISAILKKGILYEANNMEMDVVIPMKLPTETQEVEVRVYIKAENMKLRIEKEA